MSKLPEYFADIVAEMKTRSAAIRRDFATHRPSGGAHREHLIGTFLRDHLPPAFGVETGLVVSHNGQFSNQADLVITDAQRVAGLHRSSGSPILFVEGVHALVEIKTQLTPSELHDSVGKCQRFKALPRRFLKGQFPQRSEESLFVIWAYESASPETCAQTIRDELKPVPFKERPDLIVVPGGIVARSGAFLEVATLGQEGSAYRADLIAKHGTDVSHLLGDGVAIADFGDNSLFVFYLWLDSWLRQVGPRQPDLMTYLPPTASFGRTL